MILTFRVFHKVIFLVILVFNFIPAALCSKNKFKSSANIYPLIQLLDNQCSANSKSGVTSKIYTNKPNNYTSSINMTRSTSTIHQISSDNNETRKLKSAKSFNVTSKQCKRMQLSQNISQISVMANFGDSRLGNQMCNFASLYDIHKEFGILSYLKENLTKCYKILSTYHIQEKRTPFTKYGI